MIESGKPSKGITRRRLLITGAAAVSAVAVAKLLRASFMRNAELQPKPLAPAAPVAIVACDSYRIDALRVALDRGFDLASPQEGGDLSLERLRGPFESPLDRRLLVLIRRDDREEFRELLGRPALCRSREAHC